jgi:hypothetical protein
VILKDTLKRVLALAGAPVQAEQKQEEVEMTTNVAEGAVAHAEVDVAALQGAVTSLTELLAEKDAKIAELSALVEAATEFKAAQEKAAAEAKAAARNAALVEVVGTEQAASLMAATAAMDDAAFDAVLSAMSFKAKTEAESPAFKEVGAEGATDQTKLAQEVYGGKTADYLQAIVKKEIN